MPNFHVLSFPLLGSFLEPGFTYAALSLKGKAGRMRLESLNNKLAE